MSIDIDKYIEEYIVSNKRGEPAANASWLDLRPYEQPPSRNSQEERERKLEAILNYRNNHVFSSQDRKLCFYTRLLPSVKHDFTHRQVDHNQRRPDDRRKFFEGQITLSLAKEGDSGNLYGAAEIWTQKASEHKFNAEVIANSSLMRFAPPPINSFVSLEHIHNESKAARNNLPFLPDMDENGEGEVSDSYARLRGVATCDGVLYRPGC